MYASPQERLAYRKKKVAPLVDDLFEWAKDRVNKTANEKTRAALQYLINQELYLRAFLTDGLIPLDNSDALSEGITYPNFFPGSPSDSGLPRKMCA